MIRRAFAHFAYPLTIGLALLCVAASKPKHQVRRATPVEDEDEVAVASQTNDLGSSLNVVPQTRAASVIVEDARTGEVLYEKNADAPRAAASTQKLLTA